MKQKSKKTPKNHKKMTTSDRNDEKKQAGKAVNSQSNKPKNAPKKNSRKTSGKKNKKSKSHGIHYYLRKALYWGFVLFLWAVIFIAGVIAWHAKDLPEITSSADFERKFSVTVEAYDGSVLARYGELGGVAVSISEVPSELIYAVTAVEDRKFYQHKGLDPLGILRAAITNVSEGRVVQGGSTITQQLAKNLFLSHDRKLKRKIREALLSLWLEHKLTKDEIMTAYLNRVYLGSGAYGVQAASEIYFGKNVKDLNLRECATLAGLLKAPSRYSPINNPELSRERTDTVLKLMQRSGFITETDLKRALSGASDINVANRISFDDNSRYFTDYVIEETQKIIGTYSGDIVVRTSLIPEIQNKVIETVKSVIDPVSEEKHIGQAAVIIAGNDGSIVAMTGGREYKTSQFNRATDSYRASGSAFKPIVYISALEKDMRADRLIDDAPLPENDYSPENFDHKYHGKVSMSTALALSLNSATVRLAKETGIENIIATARRLGIKSDLNRDLSTALGSSGVPMTDLVKAYLVMANKGYETEVFAITEIKDKQGKVYYKRETDSGVTNKRIISRKTALNIRKFLAQAVDNGTGRRAKITGVTTFGKTGTSQDYRDAWFIGFTDSYTGAVWLGNDDNSPMQSVTGGSFPAIIWKEVMKKASSDFPLDANPDRSVSGFSELIKRFSAHGMEHSEQNRYNR